MDTYVTQDWSTSIRINAEGRLGRQIYLTSRIDGRALVNDSEGNQRWALVGLLLWTPIVLCVIAGAVYVIGRWILRIW
jgi:hypothetical protein